MKNIILALKGAVFGIANIIPGVSGGTMAVIMKVYEKLLESINSIFKHFKESMKFLIPFGIGIIIALLLGSKLINICLDKCPIPTSLFFAGLVLGGVPLVYKGTQKKFNIKNIIIFLITTGIVVGMLFIPTTDKSTIKGFDYFLLFICGFVAAAAMIIPGISGSMVLMLIGYYNTIINALNNLTNMELLGNSILILLPFGIGVVIGFLSCCRLIAFLIKKFPIESYFAILGFVIASIISIIYKACLNEFDIIQLIIGIILIPIGFSITFILSKKDLKNNENQNIDSSI